MVFSIGNKFVRIENFRGPIGTFTYAELGGAIKITAFTGETFLINWSDVTNPGTDAPFASQSEFTNYLDANMFRNGGLEAVSIAVVIDGETVGTTYSIPEAIESLLVNRGGAEASDYTFTGGIWTFTSALVDGETLRFIYNKAA